YQEINATQSALQEKWKDLGVLDPSHPDYKMAIGHLASWSNRTNGLDSLRIYLTGGTLPGQGDLRKLTAPPTLDDIIDYLSKQKQFEENPDEMEGVTSNIIRGYDLYDDFSGLDDLH